MQSKNSQREKALKKVQRTSFMVDEARLYLDMHPQDVGAQKIFDKYNQMRKIAMKEFEQSYGALLSDNINAEKDGWTWIDQPFPWDEGV